MALLASSLSYALSGGQPVDPAVFPSVVELLIVDSDGNVGACTGTKVGERKYLTAAHCVSDFRRGKGNGGPKTITQFAITHGDAADQPFFHKTEIEKVLVNPAWYASPYNASPLMGYDEKIRMASGSDQAIIVVTEENSLPIVPVDFRPIREGEVIFSLGYGTQNVLPTLRHPSGMVIPGLTLPSGQLRMSAKRVFAAWTQPRILNLPAEDANFDTFSQISGGDSGGPVLRMEEDARPPLLPNAKVSLVGIISFSANTLFVDPRSGQLTVDYRLQGSRAPYSGVVRMERQMPGGIAVPNVWLREALKD